MNITPTFRDKQVQIILAQVDPHTHFEHVAMALRGLDYEEDILLLWMESGGYDKRPEHNEANKLSRFNAFRPIAEALEGEHVRGFSTLIDIWKQEGHTEIQLLDAASRLLDADVEFIAGPNGKGKNNKRIKLFTPYIKQSPKQLQLPTRLHTATPEEQYVRYLELMFSDSDLIWITNNPCVKGMSVSRTELLGSPELRPMLININPCNGESGKRNVTSFRHVLVEFDTGTLQEQYSWLVHLQLPITCLTFSGNKSLHAAVRVDADSAQQYTARVKIIEECLLGVGAEFDTSCKDPCRYTRCAGAVREGITQKLLDTMIGSESFTYWHKIVYPSFVDWDKCKK